VIVVPRVPFPPCSGSEFGHSATNCGLMATIKSAIGLNRYLDSHVEPASATSTVLERNGLGISRQQGYSDQYLDVQSLNISIISSLLAWKFQRTHSYPAL
jgi:hypothetical protein